MNSSYFRKGYKIQGLRGRRLRRWDVRIWIWEDFKDYEERSAKRKMNFMEIQHIIDIHESYKKSIHSLVDDLGFWYHFINNWAIPEFQKQNQPRLIRSSGYGAYDHSPVLPEGYFKMSLEIREIHSQDLEQHSNNFFNWLMNLSLVRAYNALEILLLKTINTAFLNLQTNTFTSKRERNKIDKEIDRLLNIKSERINNKHLIQFLKENSTDFNSWLQLKVRVDTTITWQNFFYLISVLRHCIVHQAMVLHQDLINDINSKASKDFFERYFSLTDVGNNSFELQPIQDKFNNFLDMIIEFAVNTLKFVSGQPDFKFLKMY